MSPIIHFLGAGGGVAAFTVAVALVGGPRLQVLADPNQQAQTPTFRTSVSTVEVTVVVRNHEGSSVRGLTRQDFSVEENGVAQDIALFSAVDVPRIRSKEKKRIGDTAAHMDVASNTILTARAYVLLMDAPNVDPARSARARQLAKKFINEYMFDGDSAAVVTLGSSFGNQDFTTDRRRLIAAVDSFIGAKSESAALAKLGGGRDSETGVKAFNARLLFESLRRICEGLGAVTRTRRAVVMFSEGLEIDTTDLIGANSDALHAASTYAAEIIAAQRTMLAAAQRANVALYAIDPRGLTIGEDILIRARSAAAIDITRETQRSQSSLRLLANQTGGSALVNSNDFDRGFREVVEANSVYYVLGYTPSPRGTGFRRIGVSVRRSGLEVTARPGYFADHPTAPSSTAVPAPMIALAGASPRMQELLANPLQQAGLDIHATAASIGVRGKDRVVVFVAEFDGAALPFALDEGLLHGDLEVALIAVDRNGKIGWSRATAGKIRFSESERARVAKGIRFVFEAQLPPGEYQVRLAVIERTRGAAGSVILDVDVKKRSEAGVVTALLLMRPGDGMPTTGSATMLNAWLPSGAPTTNHRFAPSEPLIVFAALPPPAESSGRPVDVTLVVLRDDGSEALRLPPLPAVRRQVGETLSRGVLINVPADALGLGAYRLQVEVREGGRTVKSATIGLVVGPG